MMTYDRSGTWVYWVEEKLNEMSKGHDKIIRYYSAQATPDVNSSPVRPAQEWQKGRAQTRQWLDFPQH